MTRTYSCVLVLLFACGEVKTAPDGGGDDGGAVPGAPTGVAAAANVDQGVRLSWTAPAQGAPITAYTVTPSPAGGTIKIAGTQAVVEGLAVGTSYTFTVTATNSTGTGPASDPSSAVTVVAGPPAPTGMIACGADGQVTFRATGMGQVASFNIYSDTAAGVSKLSSNKQTATMLPFVQTGVTNGQQLHYVMTAVDAAGIESADSNEDAAMPDNAPHDTIFAGSYVGSNAFIEVIDCLTKYPNGSHPPARKITGAATGIVSANYNELAVDPAKAFLYYRNPTSVLVFGNATKATGNIAPTRTLTSSSLTAGAGIALDTTRDLLYIIDNTNKILVFANASTANGAVSPVRTITSAAITNLAGSLSLDVTNDRLYVANYTNVLVFNNASTANGAPAPARTIPIAGATLSSFGVAVDTTNDILYISSRDQGTIHSMTASTANGAVTPLRTITGLDTPMGNGIINNMLFSFSDNNAVIVSRWNNANTKTGAVMPDVAITWPTLTAEAGFAYAP